MSNWATLEEVKFHLRYDDDANDSNLLMYIKAAERAISRYITEEIPVEGEADIKVATLMLVGYFDENRSASIDAPTNGNYLPMPVISLLYDYRKPTAI